MKKRQERTTSPSSKARENGGRKRVKKNENTDPVPAPAMVLVEAEEERRINEIVQTYPYLSLTVDGESELSSEEIKGLLLAFHKRCGKLHNFALPYNKRRVGSLDELESMLKAPRQRIIR